MWRFRPRVGSVDSRVEFSVIHVATAAPKLIVSFFVHTGEQYTLLNIYKYML